MLWSRDDYLDYMHGRRVERQMFIEMFGLLIGLDQQWREQGATEAELALDAFDFDVLHRHPCGGRCGPLLGEPEILQDTDTQRISRDALGRTLMLDKRTATIALPVTFPVENMDDWMRVKPFFVDHPDRIDPQAVASARQACAEGALIQASIPGGYNILRELMGEMQASFALYDQPELIRDIIATVCETSLRTLDTVSRQVPIDRVAVHEDFAGCSGPLIGPDHFRSFIGPYYREIWDLLEARGASLFGLDSDGDVNPLIDVMLEAGINELFPNEPAAGMDIVALRQRYGSRLMLRGGINKFALREGPTAIDQELDRRITPATTRGGVVFAIDHRIPDGVSIANYRYYVDQARRKLGLPPRDMSHPCPWQRSA